MIAFCGFMPMAAGVTPTIGGKAVGQANSIDGSTHRGEASLPVDLSAGSFMEWVQTVMDGRMPALADGQPVFDHPGGMDESSLLTPDTLQAMIAEAPCLQMDQQMDQSIDQAPAEQLDIQSSQPGNLDNEKTSISPKIITADPTASANGVAPQVAAVTNSPATVGHPSPTAAYQTLKQGDANPTQANSLTLDVQEGKNSMDRSNHGRLLEPTPGQQSPISDPSTVQAQNSTTTLTKNLINNPANDTALAAAAISDHEVHTGTDRSIQGRSSAGSEILVKASEPSAVRQATMADQSENMASISAKDSVNNPASMNATATDQKEASSSNDTANDRGRDEHRSTRSTILADTHENELPKNQWSDVVRNTAVEVAQSRPAFQDSAKVVTADSSMAQSVKSPIGQAATLTRPDASAERTFQTTVMDQIVDKAAVRSLNGRSEIRIQLKPEFLGNVQMNIASDKDQLMVRILTDQPVVKEIIETHLNHLKTELANQGLTIDKFDITVNPDADHQSSRDQFAQMFKNPSFQNGRRQAREQDPETMNQGDGKPSSEEGPKRDGINYFA